MEAARLGKALGWHLGLRLFASHVTDNEPTGPQPFLPGTNGKDDPVNFDLITEWDVQSFAGASISLAAQCEPGASACGLFASRVIRR